MATKQVFSVTPDFLSAKECDQLVKFCEQFKDKWEIGEVSEDGIAGKAERDPIRSCKTWFIQGEFDEKAEKEAARFYRMIDERFNRVKLEMGLDDWVITEREAFQYTHYEKNDGYGWHKDTHDEPYDSAMGTDPAHDGLNRKLSMTIFLNDFDEWTEGRFEIENPWVHGPNDAHYRIHQFQPEFSDQIKKGTAIVFPSYIQHRVSPVQSGVRKSLVAWYLGPPWV